MECTCIIAMTRPDGLAWKSLQKYSHCDTQTDSTTDVVNVTCRISPSTKQDLN